ncbi:MAG TPA: hypothetical protein VN033_11490 [Vulgatibacter sp.]|nr:hypothetical protein [Vulgatibacter sp.]
METRHVHAWLAAFALALGVAGCADPEEGKKGDSPRIVSFEAAPDQVVSGGEVTLSWKTAHASSLQLMAGDVEVDVSGLPVAEGSVVRLVTQPTTFTLTARGDGPDATASVTVEVVEPNRPEIQLFTATPEEISAGESATLAWKTERAVSIAIAAEPGGPVDLEGAAADEGSIAVEPAVTTTYRLTATGASGTSVERTAKVTVRAGPTVTLAADPDPVPFGESTTLTWTSTGATSIEVSGPEGVIRQGTEPSGEIEVSPVEKTTYTVVAEGPGGSATASVEVAVAPVIEEFVATRPGAWRVGMDVELSWRTRGAHALSLSNGDGFEVDFSEEYFEEWTLRAPVGPSGVFVLRAVNGDEVVTAEVEVDLTDLPVIAEFDVDSAAVTADPDHPASILVTWSVVGADELTLAIDPGEEEVLASASGSMRVSVTETTSFRLVAESATGTVEAEKVVLVGGTPAILTFTASPSRVATGEFTVIEWDAVNAAHVVLEQDDVDVGIDPGTFRGSYEVALAADSTFRLIVENVAGERVSSPPLPVTIGAPIIRTFSSTPSAAAPGTDLELAWENDGGTSLELAVDGEVVCASAEPANIRKGSCIVAMPASVDDVTFTLTVTNSAGSDSVDLQVGNLGGPQIDSFIVSPGLVEAGKPLHFQWRVRNDADGIIPTISLTDDHGGTYDVSLVHPNQGDVDFVVSTPGTYVFTLEATTPGTKPARALQSVVVQVIPKVLSFVATPDTATSETDPVLLEWTTQDALHLRIFQLAADGTIAGAPLYTTSVQAEADEGSFSVQPTFDDPDFLLELENAAGTIVQEILRVGVNRADVLSFTATPDQFLRGETTTLEWSTANATRAELTTAQRWVEIDEPFIDLTGMPGVEAFEIGGSHAGVCKKLDFPDGFTFLFDGFRRSSVTLCHGMLSFDTTMTSTTTINRPMPSADYRALNLMPFWDDLVYAGGQILTGFVGTGADREFVVQYKNYAQKESPSTVLNFEVVMREDGTFDFRYGEMSDSSGSDKADGGSATIGWQNGALDEFAVLSHNAPFPGGLSHRSFHFPRLPLTRAPESIPGAYVDLEGAPDAQQLVPGFQGGTGWAELTFPQGFTFTYGGRTYSSLYVTSSGYLTIEALTGNPSVKSTNGRMLVGGGILGNNQQVHIAPYWQNITNQNTNNGGDGGKLFYALRSDAEGRYLIIQWKGYSGQGVADSDLNFEVFLREANGSFEFHYGPMTSPTTPGVADGSLATIGYQDKSGTWGWEHSFETAIPNLSGTGLRFHQRPTVPLSGNLDVRPLGSVEYRLEASNAGSFHEVGVQVSVATPVQIFASVSPTEPAPFEDFWIEWEAHGAMALRISDDSGRVLHWALPDELAGGSFPIVGGLPRGEHTFHLWGVGAAGDTQDVSVEVVVEDPFSIDTFEATPSRIKVGETATLVWSTTNTTSVSIELLDGTPVGTPPLAGSGSLPVSPTVTTTYRLIVESHGRVATSEETVEVRTTWIDELEADPETFAGGSVALSWDTSGGGTAFFRQPAAIVEDVSAENPFVDIDGTTGATSVTMPGTSSFGSITLPFPFPDPTGGSPKTAIRVNPRGIANFTTLDFTTTKTTFPPSSGATNDRARMGIFWDSNLQVNGPAGTTPATLTTKHVTDPGGSQSFIIQWKNLKLGSTTASARGSLNFQLVLHDDGSFEYRYGTMAPGDAINAATPNTIAQAKGSTASIGFQRYDVTQAYQLSYNQEFPGGLENRSFRFGRSLPAGGQLNVLLLQSTDIELCIEDDDWIECETRRIVVPRTGDLLISEIMAAPASDPDAQWFEVRNVSPDPIDLDGKVIRAGDESVTIAAPGGAAIVPSGGYATLSRTATVAFVPDVVYGTAIDLAEGDIRIDHGPVTLASAAWDATWFTVPGLSRYLDPSRQIRGAVSFPNLTDWCEESLQPLGNGDFGTPGFHGSTCLQSFYEVDYLANLPFIDILDSGTRLPDITIAFKYAEVPGGLSFDFPFFGNVLPAGQELWAAVNGTLGFGYFGDTKGLKLGADAPVLPQSEVDNVGLVVAFWNDLRPQTGTSFNYETLTIDGRQVMVFQWTGYTYNARTGWLTFQAQLWEDGDIVVVYDSVSGNDAKFLGNTSTVGLEDVGGGAAIQGYYRQPILFPGQAILFRPKGP